MKEALKQEPVDEILDRLEVFVGGLGKAILRELRTELATPPAAQRKPLTDVIKAAQRILEWTEIAHRPPMRDRLEVGRMAMVRVHALADLHDALAAHGIKENT